MDSFQVWLDGVPAWLRDWGTLLGTFMLLLVTGWYAVLTHRLARSSEEASSAARDAAEAAKSSAAIAAAGTEIDFTVDVYDAPEGVAPKIILTCAGAAVFVHGAVLATGVVQKWGADPDDKYASLDFYRVPEGALHLHASEEPLPRRLHRGEKVAFDSPSDHGEPDETWIVMMLYVEYSFDGEHAGQSRTAIYEDFKKEDMPKQP